MPKVLSSTKPNPKSSLANTFIACQYSLTDCKGQGHVAATGLTADNMHIQMIKPQITKQVPPKSCAGWVNPLIGKGIAARTQFSISRISCRWWSTALARSLWERGVANDSSFKMVPKTRLSQSWTARDKMSQDSKADSSTWSVRTFWASFFWSPDNLTCDMS